jgi:hypothetical protein
LLNPCSWRDQERFKATLPRGALASADPNYCIAELRTGHNRHERYAIFNGLANSQITLDPS